MKFWTKKRAAALGLAAVMTLSLVACGEKAPSLEEVEQAIEAGTLTMEDALDKGWVDETWAENYIGAHSVPASDKMEAYRWATLPRPRSPARNLPASRWETSCCSRSWIRKQRGQPLF